MLSREEIILRGKAQGELTSAERFAVDAMHVFGAHPLMKAIEDTLMTILERLDTLTAIIERLKSSNTSPSLVFSLVLEQIAKLQQAHRVVRTIQTESIPAVYALSDTTVNNRLEVLERYRQEVLNLPAVFQPRIPLRIRSNELWRYSDAIWEGLNELNWIASDSPTKYISYVANNKLKQRQTEEEKEHIDARLEGCRLAPEDSIIEDAGADDEQPTVTYPAEPGAEDQEADPLAVDLSGLPEEIITCVKMARDGRKWPEIAEHLGTDTSHLLQKVRRTIESLPPDFRALLKDRANYARFAPPIFTEEVATLTARMHARVITKLPSSEVQKPDPTRACPTGQIGGYRRVWLNNFNDKVCGNSDFDDTNSM
jgi:hypothetical protein